MRELKFRAWNKADNEWWEGGGCVTFTFEDMTSWEDWPRCCRFEDLIFMQYTGLKDKNGKEIYENDIIRIQNYSTKWKHEEPSGDWRIFEVRWNRYLWSLRNPWIAIPLSDYDTGTLEPWHIEVIGNIYENPDLLK